MLMMIKHGKIKLKAKNYSKLNEEQFKHDVDNFDWNVVYVAGDVDTAWNSFVKNHNSILDRHAPWLGNTKGNTHFQ